MEYEEETNNENKSFLERIKESPRTVSALIIILIVAAAMYAFSGDETDLQNELALNDTGNEEQVTADGEEDAAENGGDQQSSEEGEEAAPEETTDAEPAATPEPVSREELAQESQSLPEASRSEEGFTEVAQPGEGITHLARRATTRYLSEQENLSLSDEHRIYMEDFIQNAIGAQQLGVGEQVMVSNDLLRSAADAAQQLDASQLQNLSQYTPALGS